MDSPHDFAGNVSALAQGKELPFLRAQGQTSGLGGPGSAMMAGPGGPSMMAGPGGPSMMAGPPRRAEAAKGSFYDFSAKVWPHMLSILRILCHMFAVVVVYNADVFLLTPSIMCTAHRID